MIESTESAVLSCAMTDPSVLPRISEILTPDHFGSIRNRLIYEVMTSMVSQGEDIDLITVRDELKKRGQMDAAGGETYLANIGQDLPDPARVGAYARSVRDAALTRRVYELAAGIHRMKSMEPAADDLLNKLSKGYEEIVKSSISGEGIQTAGPAIDRLVTQIKEGFEPGLPSGFVDFDDMTYGFGKGKLYVLAGRPGMGKTALLVNLLTFLCGSANGHAAFFSMEMGVEEIMMRILSAWTSVPLMRLKQSALQEAEWEKVAQAQKDIHQWRLSIIDRGYCTPGSVVTQTQRIAFNTGRPVDAIFVDYVQLMNDPSKSGNRTEEVSSITRKLKLAAKDLNCPVIMVSQLSREVEKRVGHRPTLADLRESGSIEQDADVVSFLYREGYYKKLDDTNGATELIVAKNRSGPTGTVPLVWHPEFTRFSTR